MKNYLIELTIPTLNGRPAYLAGRVQWDGAWYTEDRSEAKTYVRSGNAERTVASYGASWDGFNPRVVAR
jgi:hypothetical protein